MICEMVKFTLKLILSNKHNDISDFTTTISRNARVKVFTIRRPTP